MYIFLFSFIILFVKNPEVCGGQDIQKAHNVYYV